MPRRCVQRPWGGLACESRSARRSRRCSCRLAVGRRRAGPARAVAARGQRGRRCSSSSTTPAPSAGSRRCALQRGPEPRRPGALPRHDAARLLLALCRASGASCAARACRAGYCRERLSLVGGLRGDRLGHGDPSARRRRSSRPGCGLAYHRSDHPRARAGATWASAASRGTFHGASGRGHVHRRRGAPQRASVRGGRRSWPPRRRLTSPSLRGGRIRTYVRITPGNPAPRHGRLLRLGRAGAAPRAARPAGDRRRRARRPRRGLRLLVRGARLRRPQRHAHLPGRAPLPAGRCSCRST